MAPLARRAAVAVAAPVGCLERSALWSRLGSWIDGRCASAPLWTAGCTTSTALPCVTPDSNGAAQPTPARWQLSPRHSSSHRWAGVSCLGGGRSFSSSALVATRRFNSPISWDDGREHQYLALNNIADNPGATSAATRVGRGIGSGKGKTAGRGHKGQKARKGTGKPRIGFEGGQTSMRRRIPKRGFVNLNKLEFSELTMRKLLEFIDQGRVDASQLITMKTMVESGLVRRVRDGVKLLATGAHRLDRPLHIEVSRATAKARSVVAERGGSVTTVHYNRLGLRALVKPEWFERKGRLLPRPARPPPRIARHVDAVGRLPAPSEPTAKANAS